MNPIQCNKKTDTNDLECKQVEVNTDELDFGTIEVSNDYSLKATIMNKSLTQAEYKVFIK